MSDVSKSFDNNMRDRALVMCFKRLEPIDVVVYYSDTPVSVPGFSITNDCGETLASNVTVNMTAGEARFIGIPSDEWQFRKS